MQYGCFKVAPTGGDLPLRCYLTHNCSDRATVQEKGLDRAKISDLKTRAVEEDNLLSATSYAQRNLIERDRARHRSFFRSANLGDDRVGAFFGLSALSDPRA